MPADNDFDSFRRSHADVDVAAERRIRDRFEELRASHQERRDVTQLAPAEVEGDEPASWRRNARTRGILIGVAAAVALLAVVVTVRLAGMDESSQITAGVDDLPLTDLAARARDRPGLVVPAGGVLYVHQRSGQHVDGAGDVASSTVITSADRWVHPDGTGLDRTTVEVVAEGPGQVPQVPSGVQESRVTEPKPFLDFLPYDELLALPTTPEGLLDAARAVSTFEEPAAVAEWLTRVLALETTPPEVRAAAFVALEAMGAKPVGRVQDTTGRTGIAFGDDTVDPSWMVVVDPSNTAILAFARDVGPSDAPIRGAERWTEWSSQRVESGLPD